MKTVSVNSELAQPYTVCPPIKLIKLQINNTRVLGKPQLF